MRYRHKLRGTDYEVLAIAKMQDSTLDVMDEATVIVYRGEQDGKIYVRRSEEFHDGRFEMLPPRDQDPKTKYLDVVCDGPPGPEAGRFVELENDKGRSVARGEWIARDDGYHVLRLTTEAFL